MNTLILLVLAAMTAVEQAAPISSNNAIATNTPITDANIPALKVKAEREITSVLQEIQQLEKHNVRHSEYS